MLRSNYLLPSTLLCLYFFVSPLCAQSNKQPSPIVNKPEIEKWHEDLRYLAEEMPRRHKNLFHNMTPEQFRNSWEKLDRRISTLARHQIIVELARIIAMVGDGHTAIERLFSDPKIGFRSYPLKLYLYKDGLFIQSADRKYADVVGARLVKIGNTPVDQAIDIVSPLIPHDNEMGIKAYLPLFLQTPEVLHATGLINNMDKAQFVVEEKGQRRTVILSPTTRTRVGQDSHNWANANDGAQRPKPLWLKNPHDKYWFEYLADARTVYVQFNEVENKEDEPLADFSKRVFNFVEAHPVDRLILDLRLNGGGTDVLGRALLLGLIKCDKINQRGKLFTIIGRETFSAAQTFVNQLEYYTNTLFVGEPTAQNVHFYSDPRPFVLPNSGIKIRAAIYWHQNMNPNDRRKWTAPHLAAELTSDDFRTNVDPAMEAIIRYVPGKGLTEMLREALSTNNLALALKLYREFKDNPAHVYVNTEDEMNELGYELMGKNRYDQAIEIFRLNVVAYPNSANAHDSLGEAYMNNGNRELAIRHYERALQLDPQMRSASEALQKLRGK